MNKYQQQQQRSPRRNEAQNVQSERKMSEERGADWACQQLSSDHTFPRVPQDRGTDGNFNCDESSEEPRAEKGPPVDRSTRGLSDSSSARRALDRFENEGGGQKHPDAGAQKLYPKPTS